MNWTALLAVFWLISAISITLGFFLRGVFDCRPTNRPAGAKVPLLVGAQITFAGSVMQTHMSVDSVLLEQIANGFGKHLVDMPSARRH